MDRPVEISGIEDVPGLDPELVQRVVARVRQVEPSSAAVLVSGSYAKRSADSYSDLDLQAATTVEPGHAYRSWFEERAGAPPLHVSVASKSIDDWLAKRPEPQEWALGFTVLHVVRYLWTTDEARAKLGDPPSNYHPAGDPELGDFTESVGKVRRARVEGDGFGVRMAARAAGLLAPRLLRPLNDAVVVRDRREALEAALSFPVAPASYRDDLVVVLGLVSADDDAVADAALRLARELLAFLRTRKPDVDPEPDIARYLADGTLERRLGFDDEERR